MVRWASEGGGVPPWPQVGAVTGDEATRGRAPDRHGLGESPGPPSGRARWDTAGRESPAAAAVAAATLQHTAAPKGRAPGRSEELKGYDHTPRILQSVEQMLYLRLIA